MGWSTQVKYKKSIKIKKVKIKRVKSGNMAAVRKRLSLLGEEKLPEVVRKYLFIWQNPQRLYGERHWLSLF